MFRPEVLILSLEVFTRSMPFVVRVHSAIAVKDGWPRLWYCLRALDSLGRGTLKVSIKFLKSILKAGTSTIYQWLREGKKAAAFRSYSIRRGELSVWLGGLIKVCCKLNIDFGSVTLVPLGDVLELVSLRSVAATATLTALQKDSSFAAKCKLKEKERSFYKVASLDQIFGTDNPASNRPGRASVGIEKVTKRKVFVNQRFLPFGCSQNAIAYQVGRSDRTIRRYMVKTGMEYRQVCQYKPEYKEIVAAMKWESSQYKLNQVEVIRTNTGYSLFEPNGTSSIKRSGYQVSERRFFKHRGKTYILRCNLYRTNQQLLSMKFSHKRLASLMSKNRAGGPSPKGLDRGV